MPTDKHGRPIVWRKVVTTHRYCYRLFGHDNWSYRFVLECGHTAVAKGSAGEPRRKRCRDCERISNTP